MAIREVKMTNKRLNNVQYLRRSRIRELIALLT